MKNWITTGLLIVLTAAATYLVSEWAVMKKGGTHDLREHEQALEQVRATMLKHETQLREEMRQQVVLIEDTFRQYRAVMERRHHDDERLIDNLSRQIQALNAQRTPVEQVAALRAASRPVRWAAAVPVRLDLSARAKAAGFTQVEVRP